VQRVREDKGKTVSITLQPFAFMFDREQKYVTVLPPNYRGHAYVRDSASRYHQRLADSTFEVPKIATFGIKEDVVYWNQEHHDVTDSPALNWLVFENEHFADAISLFRSPLSAIRFVDIIEVHPDGDEYDPYDIMNHASTLVKYVYNRNAGALTRAGARTLEEWLLHPNERASKHASEQAAVARDSSSRGSQGPTSMTVSSLGQSGSTRAMQSIPSMQSMPSMRSVQSVQSTLDTFFVPQAQSNSSASVEAREDLRITDACCYDIILAQYKVPIEALQKPDANRKDHKKGRYTDLMMTHKGLWRFFHGDRPFDATQMGLTLREFRTFFVHMKLQLTVVDIYGDELMEASHVPDRPNQKINPRHTWVLQHSAHLFLLTDGLNSLCKLPRSVLTVPVVSSEAIESHVELRKDKTPRAASVHYYIGGSDADVIFIDCLDKLLSIDLDTKELVIHVKCPIDMVVALHEFLDRCKVLPGVKMRANKIISLKLRIGNKDIVLSPPDSAPNDRTVMLFDKAEFDLYRLHEKSLFRSVIKHSTLSSYSPDVAKTFRELPRTPLFYNTGYAGADLFDADFAATSAYTGRTIRKMVTSEHDLSKAHTAALLAMEYFPVLSVFDRFKPFDTSSTINDHAFYIVRRPDHITVDTAEHLVLDQAECLVTGITARLVIVWPGVVIESVLEPSRLESAAASHQAIRAIWGSDLSVEHKKFIVNKVVGLTGRRYNTREWTQPFLDENEARHFRNQRIGSKLLSRKLPNGSPIYFVHNEERAELVDGLYPIHHCVGDWVRRELYKRAIKVARPIVAVKTDALTFAGLEADVKKEHTFEGIGQWGVKVGSAKLPDIPHKVRSSTFVPVALDALPVVKLHIEDEWNRAEMGTLLDSNNFVLLRGDLPGVGKTDALKHHCDKKTTLFVASVNKLAFDLRASGFQAVTADKLLGLHVGDENAHDIRGMNVDAFTTIVFDEIFFHGVPKLARIKDFTLRHENLPNQMPRKFYATGDPYQNPPIETLSVSNTRAYYDDAVSSIFPYQLTLRICKRIKNPGDQALLESIKHRLFVLNENPAAVLRSVAKPIQFLHDVEGTAICFKNETADTVNSYLHELATADRTDLIEVGGASYYIGLELICRKRVENVHFADDSGEFKKRGVLHTNYSYKVLKVTEDALELDDFEHGRVLVPHSKAQTSLAYAHAFTGHSFQGMSIDGPIAIFDHKFSRTDGEHTTGLTPEWVYTAISRGRDLSKIYVYVGTLGVARDNNIRIKIKKKIYGHKAADKRAGRKWDEEDYITFEDVFDLINKQKQRCALCSERMQFVWTRNDHGQFSIDRIDNDLAHITSNCQLTCLTCNKKKQ
jgi:hypothetical protein